MTNTTLKTCFLQDSFILNEINSEYTYLFQVEDNIVYLNWMIQSLDGKYSCLGKYSFPYNQEKIEDFLLKIQEEMQKDIQEKIFAGIKSMGFAFKKQLENV